MNSKERVMRAVNHKEVDRAPFDLLGAPGEINKKLFHQLNIKIPDKLNYKHEELFEYFKVDVRRCDANWSNLPTGYIGSSPVCVDENTHEDAIGVIRKKNPAILIMACVPCRLMRQEREILGKHQRFPKISFTRNHAGSMVYYA